MRTIALIGMAALAAACSSKEAPPAADTTGMAPAAAAATSLASLAGTWNVNVMPADRDTVLTSYVLNTTDSTAWKFTFTGRTDEIPMRITGRSGDTLMTEAGPFESALRPGQQVSIKSKNTIRDGKLVGDIEANYAGTPADSIIRLRSEGTRQ